MTATTTKMRSSLSTKMAAPGGRTVAEALAKAESGLESHREAGMHKLAALLSELEATTVSAGPERLAEIYRLGAALADLAGFFETGPFYQAAFSLCDVADRMQGGAPWDRASIQVHLRALRLIQADGFKDTASSATILEGLRAVAQRLA